MTPASDWATVPKDRPGWGPPPKSNRIEGDGQAGHLLGARTAFAEPKTQALYEQRLGDIRHVFENPRRSTVTGTRDARGLSEHRP